MVSCEEWLKKDYLELWNGVYPEEEDEEKEEDSGDIYIRDCGKGDWQHGVDRQGRMEEKLELKF